MRNRSLFIASVLLLLHVGTFVLILRWIVHAHGNECEGQNNANAYEESTNDVTQRAYAIKEVRSNYHVKAEHIHASKQANRRQREQVHIVKCPRSETILHREMTTKH